MVQGSQRFNAVCFILFLASFGMIEGFYSNVPLSNQQTQLLSALSAFGVIWSSTLWLKGDAQKHNIKLPFDIGLLLWVFWPFPHIWYLFKQRGFRAVDVVLGACFAFLGAAFLGMCLV